MIEEILIDKKTIEHQFISYCKANLGTYISIKVLKRGVRILSYPIININ